MLKVTFGNCLVNSLESSVGSGKPVSKYELSTTGSVPQLGRRLSAGRGQRREHCQGAGLDDVSCLQFILLC